MPGRNVFLCIAVLAALIPTPGRAGERDDFIAGKTRACAHCDLAGVNFKRRDLAGADLSGANLKGANFHDAKLAGARLGGAELTGANLNKADLSRADLVGAMNPEDVRASETRYLGAAFHFVRL